MTVGKYRRERWVTRRLAVLGRSSAFRIPVYFLALAPVRLYRSAMDYRSYGLPVVHQVDPSCIRSKAELMSSRLIV